MGKWNEADQYRKLYHFVGSKAAWYLFFGVMAGLVVFGAELTFAYVLQMFLIVMKIIPSTSVKFPDWIPYQNLYAFLAFVTLVLVLRGVANWLNTYLTSASSEIQRDFQRYRIVEWALRAQSVSTSEIMTLYNDGIFAVCMVLSNLQMMSVYLSASALLWIFMLKISVKVTLAATAVLGFVGFFARGFDKKISMEGRRLTLQLEQINVRLMNNIKNLLLVQIYGTQAREKSVLRAKLTDILQSVLSYSRLAGLKSVLPQTIGTVMICVVSVFSTTHGWIESAMMVTYFYLFLRFTQNFSEVVKLMSTIAFYMPITVKFAKWWANHSHDSIVNPVIEDKSTAQEELNGPLGWRVNHLNYSYPNSLQHLFKDFSVEIKPGAALVITGESGSGKSTLLSILLGMLVPQSGKIELLGADGKVLPLSVARKGLLQKVGYVGSESFLIEGSILDNITYGLERTPSQREIDEALAKSGCHFISQFPAGLGHKITEQGQGLSAGQKQRLAFARALLRNPQILILDEATSNLDLETERKLLDTIQKLKGATTIVAVTHREAVLAIADQTLHMKPTESLNS